MYNKNYLYICKQNYTIINQNRKNHIHLEARAWNNLKRSLDDSILEVNSILEDTLIETILFSVHTRIGPLQYPENTKLW